MKFGKILRQTTETRMPQWRDHMLGYKALKQAIKQQLAQGPAAAWRRSPHCIGRQAGRRAAHGRRRCSCRA